MMQQDLLLTKRLEALTCAPGKKTPKARRMGKKFNWEGKGGNHRIRSERSFKELRGVAQGWLLLLKREKEMVH